MKLKRNSRENGCADFFEIFDRNALQIAKVVL